MVFRLETPAQSAFVRALLGIADRAIFAGQRGWDHTLGRDELVFTRLALTLGACCLP